MSKPADEKPPTARGKALRRSDAELDELARVSQWDINTARAYWREKTDPEFKELIEAEAEPDPGEEPKRA